MDTVQEIKNRLSISDVVSKYVTLKPVGRNMKGLCPFHDDHNPSLLVSNEKGLAWCFSCQSGGDVFGFLQKVENVDFPEALKILAEMAGVELKSHNFKDTNLKKEKKIRFSELLEESKKYFEETLKKTKKIQDIVKQRCLSRETLETFGIGYAFDDFHALEKHLSSKGFSRKEMLEAGMVGSKDKKGEKVYDRFRGRIMFPIYDVHKTLRGFGGRIAEKGDPKYLNSPETVMYHKSQILYGLSIAKQAIQKEDFCLVVEGYFDVLQCCNAGYKNTVAVSGTALSIEHVSLLKRFSSNIVFAFDADGAGKDATKRAIEIAIAEGMTVSVILLPEGQDPDEVIRNSPSDFAKALSDRKQVMDFLIEESLENRNTEDVSDQRNILKNVFPFIHLFPGELEKNHYIKFLSEKLRADERIIQKEFQDFEKKSFKQQKNAFSREIKSADEDSFSKISSLSYFIGVLSAFPELFEIAHKNFLLDIAPDGLEKRIYNGFCQAYNTSGQIDPQKVLSAFSAEEKKKWELFTLYTEEKMDRFSDQGKREEVKHLVQKLNKWLIKRKLQEISENLKTAQNKSTEEQELKKQSIDFIRLLQQI